MTSLTILEVCGGQGADIGFRVERTEGNKALGRLMVRVNGQWVEAQFSPGRTVVPLHMK